MSTTWDIHLSEAITGQISAKEALDRTYNDWKRIVDDNDKAKELKLYQDAIGYKPGQ